MDDHLDKEDVIYRAKLAELAERYDDMISEVRELVSEGTELGGEERDLLSMAYKNAVGSRRSSWRILSSIEQRDDDSSKSQICSDLARTYRIQIEAELRKICDEILELLDCKLLPIARDLDCRVFFNKMKGDYFRYLAEFSTSSERRAAAEKSLQAYKVATELAKELPPTHAIRLGLALNFSVFYYEILNNAERACQLAKGALEEGLGELESMPDKGASYVLQLLKDNLDLWATDFPDQGKAEVESVSEARDVKV